MQIIIATIIIIINFFIGFKITILCGENSSFGGFDFNTCTLQ